MPTVHFSCIRPVPAVTSVHNCSILSSYIFLLLPLYNNSTLYLRCVCSTNYLTYLRQLTPFFFFQPLQIYLPACYDQIPRLMCSPSRNILFDYHYINKPPQFPCSPYTYGYLVSSDTNTFFIKIERPSKYLTKFFHHLILNPVKILAA